MVYDRDFGVFFDMVNKFVRVMRDDEVDGFVL